MARRGVSYNGVIPQRFINTMSLTINTLANRMKSLHPMSLTHKEYLDLLAPPEHHQTLMDAAEFADVSSNLYKNIDFLHPSFEGIVDGPVSLFCTIHKPGKTMPLAPRNSVILKDAPKEIRDKLAGWVLTVADINFNAARTRALMWWLNDNCNTAAQVRFLWPTIVHIAALDEDTRSLADKMREIKKISTLPALPLEVTAACKSTSKWVAMMSLLSDDMETPKADPKVEVTCELGGFNALKREGVLGVLSGA